MELRPVCYEDREKIYSLLSTFKKNENGYINEFAEMTQEEFLTKGIQLLLDWSEGKNLYENFVPVTFYFLYDNEKNIVGVFKLRHYLNDFYKKGPGHISYAIKSEYRKKGYAKLGLNMAIQQLDKILPQEEKLIKVCCSRKNYGSFLTIQGNIPIIYKESVIVKEQKFEVCENYIDRKNRILIKKLNEINIKELEDENLEKELKNGIVLGAFLCDKEFIGYISLLKKGNNYEINKINIIKNEKNVMFGLFNYAYSFARVNKSNFIFVEHNIYTMMEKEIDMSKYECEKNDEKVFKIIVKKLCEIE